MPETSKAKWLYVVAFMDLVAVSMVVPLLSAHLKSLGASHFMTGLMSSMYAALQLISGPVFGSWSDIRGRRSIVILTLLICSLCYIVMGLTSAIFIMLLARIILGIFKQTQTLCKTLVADVVPLANQPEAYGKMNAISGIGFMVGPALGGNLAEFENGFLYICCIVTISFWINIVIAYLFLPNTYITMNTDAATANATGSPIIHETKSLHSELKRAVVLLTQVEWSVYWDVFALKFLLGFSQAVLYSNYSLSIQENFGVSPKWVGYTISFQGMIGAMSSFMVGWLNKLYHTDTMYSLRTFHGFILLSIAFCALSIAPSLGLYVTCLIPVAASGAFLRIIGMESVLQRAPLDTRGSLVGSSNSISSVARLIAPLCSGVVRDFAGSQGVSVVTVLSAVAGAFLAGILRVAETRKEKIS